MSRYPTYLRKIRKAASPLFAGAAASFYSYSAVKVRIIGSPERQYLLCYISVNFDLTD
jgi:hypothetical protein